MREQILDGTRTSQSVAPPASVMPRDAAFAALGNERFLSPTTFRQSGERVSTAVWIGRDGDALVVTTPAGSGKVKRLRNSPRLELRIVMGVERLTKSGRSNRVMLRITPA